MNLNLNIKSALYECSRHKVKLVWANVRGMLFWACPVEGCKFMKSMKSGRKQLKGVSHGV